MTPEHREAFRQACAMVLGCPEAAILWEGEPMPDAGDLGYLVILQAKSRRFEGIEDERREAWSGYQRTVTVHHQRDVTLTLEVRSYAAQVSAYDTVLELSNGLLDEAPMAVLEASGLGLVDQLQETDLSHLPDGQAMGRAIAEQRYNATWERVDLTAHSDVIETVDGVTLEDSEGNPL